MKNSQELICAHNIQNAGSAPSKRSDRFRDTTRIAEPTGDWLSVFPGGVTRMLLALPPRIERARPSSEFE